jgi:hypothetical protein
MTARLRSRAAEITVPDWYDSPQADSLYPGREQSAEFRRLLAQADDGLAPDGSMYPVIEPSSSLIRVERRNIEAARADLCVLACYRWREAVEWWFDGLPDALIEDVVLREISGSVYLPGDDRYEAAPRVPGDVAMAALGYT